MSELLPCPFCGGTPEKRLAVGEWWVSCPSCASHSKGCSNYDAAIAAWNRRSPTAGEGWRLVPLKITPEMEDAYFAAHARSKTVLASADEVWASMLSASPLPRVDGGSDD